MFESEYVVVLSLAVHTGVFVCTSTQDNHLHWLPGWPLLRCLLQYDETVVATPTWVRASLLACHLRTTARRDGARTVPVALLLAGGLVMAVCSNLPHRVVHVLKAVREGYTAAERGRPRENNHKSRKKKDREKTPS